MDHNSARARFDALSEELKASILYEYRDYNTQHIDWWDCVYEQFKESMDGVGIEVHNMYFSGFWSQGDGACFEGRIYDWELFLKSAGYNNAALIKHAQENFGFSVEHRGFYYHENCTRFCSNLPLPRNDEDVDFIDSYSPHDRDSLHEAVWLTNLNTYTEDKLESEFTDIFKDYMRDLYKLLEKEHDYLTSDEAILDSLEANDKLEEAINHAMESENA